MALASSAATLRTIPCLKDNYAYLLRDPASGETLLIDAPEEGPIREAVEDLGGRLDKLILTHHHHDHQAAAEPLRAAYGCQVFGPAAEADKLPPLDRALEPDAEIPFAGGFLWTIATGGHTLGHLAYHWPKGGAVFTGDALFSAGCGRLFEGDAAMAFAGLQRLKALPPETRICFGHEYTATNLAFAATAEPENEAARAYLAEVKASGRSTPSTLARELAVNPFLRADRPEIAAALGLSGAPEVEVFAELRRRRDKF
ncbi:hydroxyacylglutathione hydrolase [Neomegalonema perideroedes]|uniref:hydroxyacylglutathione hydrolase n=1 Tax=Neomegalonema perideroedes TaxID=217219 RepID=UPI00036D8BBF|nr:hydroxyacylglutathione hydrolase [Neomegalonema perideroedes]